MRSPTHHPDMSRKFKAVFAKLKGRRRASESTKSKMAAVMASVNEATDFESEVELVTKGFDDMDLNATTIPTPPPTSLPIPPSGTFDFCPPPCSPNWPGPRYDDLVQFVPGIFNSSRDMMLPKAKSTKAKRAVTKRSTSQDDRPAVRRLDSNIKGTTKAVTGATSKKKRPPHSASTPKKPQPFYPSPSKRQEPLHLLALPGEIRNEIYRHLYVSPEPLQAKFRPIIVPRRGSRAAPDVKRFPREPTLALVCRQLRSEASSLFYAENTFVFASAAGAVPSYSHAMTRADTLGRWMRASTTTAALTRVELRLGEKGGLSVGAREAVKYVFRKLADGGVAAALEPGTLRCVCFDEAFCAQHRGGLLVGDASGRGNLLEAVIALVERRSAGGGLKMSRPEASRVECRTCGKLGWAAQGF